MNSIQILTRNSQLRYLALGIVAIFLIVPITVFNLSYVILLLLLSLQLYMQFKHRPGIILLLFSYSLTIPYTEVKMGVGYYIPYMCVLAAAIINFVFLKKEINYDFKYLFRLAVILLILCLAFALINSSFDEIKVMMLFLISTIGIFYISFFDKLSLRSFLSVLDLIFYVTATYCFLEVFFKISPYKFIFDLQNIDFQLRMKGLFAHPLVLSGFLSVYFVALLAKGVIYKQWNIFNFLLVVTLIALSASRTGIILVTASFITYVFLNKLYRNIYFISITLVIILLSFSFLPKVGEYIASKNLSRITSLKAEQRLASYGVAFDIFSRNTFGIGISKESLKRAVTRSGVNYSANTSYNSSFLIFDNTYLTSLVSYGVFSFLIYLPFLAPLMFCLRWRKKFRISNPHVISITVLFVVWFIQNFSFDTIFYFPINAFYFAFSAVLIKDGLKPFLRSLVIYRKLNTQTATLA